MESAQLQDYDEVPVPMEPLDLSPLQDIPNSNLTHNTPSSPDEFSPGCTLTFPPERRAGQPMVDPITGKVEQYLTPYEVWLQAWIQSHPGIDPRVSPCNNELEWAIIEWSKKERIGKGTMDRLLAIPTVRPKKTKSPYDTSFIDKLYVSIAERQAWFIVQQHGRNQRGH